MASPLGVGRGLIPDEHRYREAAVRHKRLDLANRRLDARISSLESLATQGTLLAGFGYGTLTRDPDEGRFVGFGSSAGHLALSEGSVLLSLSEGIISCLAALSVGSAVWVVYLSGYAAIRARIAFLMGSDRLAADDAILVLRQTHERARDCFDLSLSALVLCASVLVINKMPWYTSLCVVGVFLLFLRDGARFKEQIDARLYPWTAQYAQSPRATRHRSLPRGPGAAVDPGGWPRCCEPVERLRALLLEAPLWRRLLGHLSPPAAATTPRQPRQPPPPPSEAAGWAAAGAGGRYEPPEVMRVRSAGKPSVLRGWLYKTSSSRGPLRRPPSRATQRRFFVLRNRRLQIFASQDRADLSPAYPPSHEIHLAQYELVDPRTCFPEGEGRLSEVPPFTLALRPKGGVPRGPKDGGGASSWMPFRATDPAELSWYLRCANADAFETWEARLREACKPAADAPEDDDSSTASEATSGEESDGARDLEDEEADGDLDEASVPHSGSGLAFLRSLFGGSEGPRAAARRPAAPPRMPSESQMRAAV